ncbi:MAG: DUF5591 domain-containing protein [Moorellales bacterium]
MTHVDRFVLSYDNPLDLLRDPRVEKLVAEILDTYQPSGKVLLVLPCSARKPYRRSPSQQLYWREAIRTVPEPGMLERATLSGVYGIVPAGFEDRVVNYNFNLNRASFTRGKHKQIIESLADRVGQFLKRYGDCFGAVIAYGRERYWELMQLVARDLQVDNLWVIPHKGASLRGEGLDELRNLLRATVFDVGPSFPNIASAG